MAEALAFTSLPRAVRAFALTAASGNTTDTVPSTSPSAITGAATAPTPELI